MLIIPARQRGFTEVVEKAVEIVQFAFPDNEERQLAAWRSLVDDAEHGLYRQPHVHFAVSVGQDKFGCEQQ
jgi:hypothetical protein